jgi:hypothetical protein
MNDIPAQEERFALTASRHFPEWLESTGGSLAFTTYQAGKLFLIGRTAACPSSKGAFRAAWGSA